MYILYIYIYTFGLNQPESNVMDIYQKNGFVNCNRSIWRYHEDIMVMIKQHEDMTWYNHESDVILSKLVLGGPTNWWVLYSNLEICSFYPDESVLLHVFSQHFQANSSGSVVRSEDITWHYQAKQGQLWLPYYVWNWILNVFRHRKLNQPGRPTSHADANDRLCLWIRSLNQESYQCICNPQIHSVKTW